MSLPDKTQAANRKRNSSPALKATGRLTRFPFLHASILALFCLAFATYLRADTLSGTVKDPSGAVIVGARIEITGGNLSQPIILASDDSGKFAAPNLAPGKYSVRVAKTGFDELVITVDLRGVADLPLNLTIAAQQTRVTVTEKNTAFANSDAVYRQLREVSLADTFLCENFTLTMYVGTFQLKSGTITLLSPVNGLMTGAIFVGHGHFTLKPIDQINTREMIRRTGNPTTEEDFTEVVFRFTGNQYPHIAGTFITKTQAPSEAAAAFQH